MVQVCVKPAQAPQLAMHCCVAGQFAVPEQAVKHDATQTCDAGHPKGALPQEPHPATQVREDSQAKVAPLQAVQFGMQAPAAGQK
jgi:hypothetical protein